MSSRLALPPKKKKQNSCVISFVHGITKWQLVKKEFKYPSAICSCRRVGALHLQPPRSLLAEVPAPDFTLPLGGQRKEELPVLPFAFTSPPPLVKPVGIHSICPTDLKLAEETRDPAGAPLHKGLLPGEHTKTSWPGAGGRQRLVPGYPRVIFSLRHARRRPARFSAFLLLFV